MTARKDKDTQDSALRDESKDVQTTKQAEAAEEALPTSPKKREVDEDHEVKASEVGTRTGLVVGGENKAFDDVEDAPVDGDTVEGATGVVVERNLKGEEYEVPYVDVVASELKPRTSDSDDAAKDWTAQHATGEREDADGNTDPVALVNVAGTPGQTFRVSELPSREVMEASGIDYDQWVAGLPVRADVPDEAPRRGIPA